MTDEGSTNVEDFEFQVDEREVSFDLDGDGMSESASAIQGKATYNRRGLLQRTYMRIDSGPWNYVIRYARYEPDRQPNRFN